MVKLKLQRGYYLVDKMFHAITRPVQVLGGEEECVTKGVDTTFSLGDEIVDVAQTTRFGITGSTVGIQVSEMEKVLMGTGGYSPGLKDLGKQEIEDGNFPLVEHLNMFFTENWPVLGCVIILVYVLYRSCLAIGIS